MNKQDKKYNNQNGHQDVGIHSGIAVLLEQSQKH